MPRATRKYYNPVRLSGDVQLNARVIVRPTFNRLVSRAFFFLEPTVTETCELALLIGVDCPSAVTGVAEILWEVPSGTLGRFFVVACIDSCCAKSDEILVAMTFYESLNWLFLFLQDKYANEGRR